MRQICGINTLCLQFFLNFKRSVNFEARTLLQKLNKCVRLMLMNNCQISKSESFKTEEKKAIIM